MISNVSSPTFLCFQHAKLDMCTIDHEGLYQVSDRGVQQLDILVMEVGQLMEPGMQLDLVLEQPWRTLENSSRPAE